MYRIPTLTASIALLASLTFCGTASAQRNQLDTINNIAGTIANVAGVAAAITGAVPPGPAVTPVGIDKNSRSKGVSSHRGHVAVHSHR